MIIQNDFEERNFKLNMAHASSASEVFNAEMFARDLQLTGMKRDNNKVNRSFQKSGRREGILDECENKALFNEGPSVPRSK